MAINFERNQCIKTLRQAIRQLHRANRNAATAYGLEMTLAEAHILLEVAAAEGKEVGASNIGPALHLTKLQASRLISGMIKNELLAEKPSLTRDKRKKTLAVTPRGMKVFRELQAAASLRVRTHSANLSPIESVRFCQLLNAHGAGGGTPEVRSLPEEPQLLAPLRRVTRDLRVFLPHPIPEVKLSNLDMLLLHELNGKVGGSFPSELADWFKLPLNTISSALSRLTKMALITNGPLTTDKRKRTVRLTKEGEAKAQELETYDSEQLARSLERFSEADIKTYTDFWVHFSGINKEKPSAATPRRERAEVSMHTGAHLRAALMASSEELTSARRLIIASLSRGLHYVRLPQTLAHSSSTVIGCFLGSTLELVFQFSKGGQPGTYELDHLASLPLSRSADYPLGEALRLALSVLRECGGISVRLDPTALHPEDARELNISFGERLLLQTASDQPSLQKPE